MSNDSEWVYNPDAPIMLSGRAFYDLCVNKMCTDCFITLDDRRNVVMEESFSCTKFKDHDATVYLYILHLCSKSKFTITSAYDIGKALHYTLRDKAGYKECQKASGSIRRLKQAGYLVHLPSFHKGKFIPLRRMHEGSEYNCLDGFQYFCNSNDRKKAFSAYGKQPKSKTIEPILPVAESSDSSDESPFGSDFEF